MSVGRYVIGVGALLCSLGSLGAGGAALRAYLLPEWRGSHARLAEVVIAVGLILGISEVLGTAGAFRLAPILVASAALGLGLTATLGPRSRGQPLEPRPRRCGFVGASAVCLAGAVVVLVGLVWAGPSLQALDHGILAADSMGYHLPHAASYAQTGQIASIRFTDYDYLTGMYPATAELLHALGIVFMGTDVLSPGINIIWALLTLLAAWCIGDRRGLGPLTLVAAAVVVGTPMLVSTNAGSADSDILGMFFVTAAVALWMNTTDLAEPAPSSPSRGAREPSRISRQTGAAPRDFSAYRGGLLVAAVAAGLALSTRMNLIAPVAALTILVPALAPPGRRRSAIAWWLGGVLAAGGYWYARNLIAVGNPVPWFGLGGFPTPQPLPLQHSNDYSLAAYLPYPGIISDWLVPALRLNLGRWWPALLLVAMLGPVACVLCGRGRTIRAVGLIALASLLAYPITPLTACGPWGHPYCFKFNIRYAAPALVLALAVMPLAKPVSGKRGQIAAMTVAAALFVAAAPLGRLWRVSYSLGGPRAAAMLVLALIVLTLAKPWLLIKRRISAVRIGVAAAGATLAFVGIAAGFSGERAYLNRRYNFASSLLGVHPMWRWARTLHHARIALVGTFGWFYGYPLYGVDDSNRVGYMGQRGKGGSFVPITDCRSWRAALNAGHYRYVVTTARRVIFTKRLVYAPEGDWTRSDPAARLVLPPTPQVRVFALNGPLHPKRCMAPAQLRRAVERPAPAQLRADRQAAGTAPPSTPHRHRRRVAADAGTRDERTERLEVALMRPRGFQVPPVGIEPTTFGLKVAPAQGFAS